MAVNGSSKLVYWLLGSMFLLLTMLSGVVYTSLSTRVQMAESIATTQASQIASMRTQLEYGERDMKTVLNELTQVRGELIAVRLLIASQSKR